MNSGEVEVQAIRRHRQGWGHGVGTCVPAFSIFPIGSRSALSETKKLKKKKKIDSYLCDFFPLNIRGFLRNTSYSEDLHFSKSSILLKWFFLLLNSRNFNNLFK